jgi:hypothetical protein
MKPDEFPAAAKAELAARPPPEVTEEVASALRQRLRKHPEAEASAEDRDDAA